MKLDKTMKVMVNALLVLIGFSGFSQGIKEKINPDSAVRECKLRYPAAALKKGIQGTVEVKMTFDANCYIKHYEVVKSLGYDCDEEAIKCIVNVQKSVRKEKNGKCKEGHEIIYPFTFRLN